MSYLTDEELRDVLMKQPGNLTEQWFINFARAAIEAHLRKHGEPVAWVAPSRGYNTVGYHSDKVNALPVGTKLYAHTPPAQASDAEDAERYIRDHCEPMSPTEIYAEGRGDQYEDDCRVVRLLLENLDDVDAIGDGHINTTRVRELLTHFDAARKGEQQP